MSVVAAGCSGVSTSTAAFLGYVEAGPEGAPVLVSSWNDFLQHFGGLAWGLQTPFAVYQFFSEGGSLAYVSRLSRPGAAAAATDVGPMAVRAASPGAWGDSLAIRVTNAPLETPPEEAERAVFAIEILYRLPAAGQESEMDRKVADYAQRNSIAMQALRGQSYWPLERHDGFTAADLAKPDPDRPAGWSSASTGPRSSPA